jgi:hypothetical protein
VLSAFAYQDSISLGFPSTSPGASSQLLIVVAHLVNFSVVFKYFYIYNILEETKVKLKYSVQ